MHTVFTKRLQSCSKDRTLFSLYRSLSPTLVVFSQELFPPNIHSIFSTWGALTLSHITGGTPKAHSIEVFHYQGLKNLHVSVSFESNIILSHSFLYPIFSNFSLCTHMPPSHHGRLLHQTKGQSRDVKSQPSTLATMPWYPTMFLRTMVPINKVNVQPCSKGSSSI